MHARVSVSALALLTATSTAGRLEAQDNREAPIVASGARVRIETSSHGTVLGSLLRLTPDSVHVTRDAGLQVAVARNDVTAFSVSEGRSPRLRPAIYGALIGAFAFGMWAVDAGTKDCYDDFPYGYICPPGPSPWGVLGSALLGGVVGGGIGYALIGGRERWQAIAMPMSAASRSVARFGLGAITRF